MTSHLTKSQRNWLHSCIREVGLEPSAFSWDEASGEFAGIYSPEVPRLVYLPDPGEYWFSFAPGPSRVDYDNDPIRWSDHRWHGAHCIQYKPGDETMVQDDLLVPWSSVENVFQSWVIRLKHELEAPDLWASPPTAELLATVERTDDNRRFSPDEVAEIRLTLEKVLYQVNVRGLLANAQFATLKERLDEQADAAERMGRKDWLNSLIGAVFGWAVSEAAGSGVGQEVLRLTMEGISHLFTTIRQLPSG